MSERVPVVLALTPVAEQVIEGQLFGPGAVIEPRASVAEADELEAAAAAAEASAVLLSPALSGLTPGHCTRVRARGLRLIGVALDQREHDALLELGVDEVSEPEPTALLAAINGGDQSQPLRPSVAAPEPDRRSGSVVAVVGSKGSPGASECAASLAALAARRWSCVLAELDLLGGGLDIRLGANAQQGSLLGLLRAADAGELALPELLERWLAHRPGWPPVLLGPPDLATALPELARPGAAAGCLQALAGVYPLCIIDVGFQLGWERELPAAARVHREALVSADAVVLILGARDEQLRAGIVQLDLLLDQLALKPERLRVVLNGVGGPGSNALRSLEPSLLARLGERGLAVDARLPWDARSLQRASSRGLPLALARPRGGYARALAGLLEELFLPIAPAPRGRKRRLVPPAEDAAADRDEEVALPWRS